MPHIWRYLLTHYFRVLLLSVIAFIAILLTTRLEDIAHFAALGPSGWIIVQFTLYQILYILPIALPISCLISAMLLIQKLSTSHELTAFRACGLSLKSILAPILISSAFISVGTFYVVSEMATSSHLATNLLKKELRGVNPLLLVNNKHLMKLKGFYAHTLGPSRVGEWATDMIVALPSSHQNRLHVMLAKQMKTSSTAFIGENVTLLSNLESKEHENTFDNLIVENVGKSTTANLDFSQIFQRTMWSISEDHLKLPLLLLKLDEEKELKQKALEEKKSASETKQVHRIYSEIARRLSLALAAFTFTLMGAAFGMNISRRQTNCGIVAVVILSALFLAAFFAAKGIAHLFYTAIAFYFAPHLLIVIASLWTLNRSTKGIE